SASRRPPTAASSSSGRIRLSAPATPAAWRSPEASPATNNTLRMVRVPDQRWESPLDLLYDPKRHTQRHPALFAGDDHRAFALECRNETFQLELQRLSVRCVELDAINERRDVGRSRTNCQGIDIGAEAEEFSGSRSQVE